MGRPHYDTNSLNYQLVASLYIATNKFQQNALCIHVVNEAAFSKEKGSGRVTVRVTATQLQQ